MKLGKFRIFWSEEDQEWVATHSSYHSLSWLGDTPDEALSGLVRLIEELV